MRRETIAPYVSAAAVLLFAGIIVMHGVPILRHDWHWPIDRASAFDWLVNATSGWRVDGIGNSSAFPTEYFYGAIAAIVALVAGPVPGLFLALVGTGAIAASGAHILCKRAQANAVYATVATFVLLFNPWVYTEIVAGHLFMVPSAFGMLFLVAALLPGPRAPLLLLLGTVFVAAQLQFAILTIPLIVWATWRVRSPLAILAAIAMLLPLLFGIAANAHEVAQTPFLPTWELSQSVTFLQALQLTGYSAGYDQSMYDIARFGVWLLLASALFCIVFSKQAAAWICVGFIFAIAAFVSGPQNFAAPIFNWSITHLPLLGLFRELYDEVGIALILYCCAILLSAQRMPRYVAFAMVGSAALLTTGFVVQAPWHFFIPSAIASHADIRIPENTRFVTIPAFQPLMTKAGGSGVDPAAISYAGNRTSLNEYIPKYPANAAIARYLRFGDPRWLEALSVSEVDFRCQFFGKRAALNPYTYDQSVPCPSHAETLATQPEAFTLPSLPIAPIAVDITQPAIFEGDVDPAAGFQPIAPLPNLDAKRGWVAAPFTVFDEPVAAQPWGGIATFATTPYTVGRGRMLFAYISGALTSSRSVVTRASGSFEWIPVHTPLTVRCAGFCELIGTADRIGQASGRVATRPVATPFKRFLPWLIRATPSETQSAYFVLRERFNRWWIAVQDGHILAHAPVNGVFNGWQTNDGSSPIFAIELIAAIQALFELIAFAAVPLLIAAALRR